MTECFRKFRFFSLNVVSFHWFLLIFVGFHWFTVIIRKSLWQANDIELFEGAQGLRECFLYTQKWNLQAKIRWSCGAEVLTTPNTRRDRAFWNCWSCVKKTYEKDILKKNETIFWISPTPIISHQKYLRKSATKVKNQGFSMIFNDFGIGFACISDTKCLHSSELKIWRYRSCDFFSSRKNVNFESKFWQWLRLLIYCADKAGFRMGIKKSQFFVGVSICESEIRVKFNENRSFCSIFEIWVEIWR